VPDFDLALAPALEMLLRERSVTRAARALGRSQPAISRELAALRVQLGDPLLIRTTGGLSLTPRGEQLLIDLPHALAHVRRAVAGPVFDPSVATAAFRISMSDYEAAILLPRVLARLEEQAPRMQIAVVQRNRTVVEAALNGGEVALAVGRFVRPGSLLHYRSLFDDDFVLIADRDHHDISQLGDLDYLLSLPFVLIAPGNIGEFRGLIDDQLDRLQRGRFVRLSLSQFTVLPGLIAAQRTVAFAPARLVTALTLPASIALCPSPLRTSPFQVGLLWHQRTHRDAAATWLRQIFIEAADQLG
jgi:DNA-binding transcriptional LysR family regulator